MVPLNLRPEYLCMTNYLDADQIFQKRDAPQPPKIRKGQPTPVFPRRVRSKASYPTDHPFPERSIAARSICWESSRNNGISDCFGGRDILVVFWAEGAIKIVSKLLKICAGYYQNLPDGLASPPDLQTADLLHLLLVSITVISTAVVVEGSLGLGSISNAVVELVEHWLESVLELLAPVNGTTTGGCRASGVHVVHAVATDEWVQTLGSLLNGLVESLAGRVATLTENLVLGKEHAVDTAHEAAALAVQIRVDLLLECRLVQVTTADSDTHSDGLLQSLASYVLEHSDGGVDTTSLTKKRSHGTAGALWSNENDIDVLWHLNASSVLEDGGETVGEVKGL